MPRSYREAAGLRKVHLWLGRLAPFARSSRVASVAPGPGTKRTFLEFMGFARCPEPRSSQSPPAMGAERSGDDMQKSEREKARRRVLAAGTATAVIGPAGHAQPAGPKAAQRGLGVSFERMLPVRRLLQHWRGHRRGRRGQNMKEFNRSLSPAVGVWRLARRPKYARRTET